jgi:hypothetical protein
LSWPIDPSFVLALFLSLSLLLPPFLHFWGSNLGPCTWF